MESKERVLCVAIRNVADVKNWHAVKDCHDDCKRKNLMVVPLVEHFKFACIVNHKSAD